MNRLLATAMLLLLAGGCASADAGRVGVENERLGDEIVAAGRLFHTGTEVVLWTDPGGYDAYRTERRFAPIGESDWAATTRSGSGPSEPARFNTRFAKPTSANPLTAAELEQVRGGGWTLPMLQERVDQFVLHYDVCGLSARCFDVLHDRRGLSVHFMLDLDGTIYQTLDLKERTWHATKANDRSIGIEIANMGAYAPGPGPLLPDWYADENGRVVITIPEELLRRYGGDGGIRRTDLKPFSPARGEPIFGKIHGRELRMWDLTPQQYDALTKLTAALSEVFPKMKLTYPQDKNGELLTRVLSDEEFEQFQGVLGHYHVQLDKVDPGPALDWERVVGGARALVGE
jgi:N-acetyl-anhydromuramyl-L-alanine amidase AmpD